MLQGEEVPLALQQYEKDPIKRIGTVLLPHPVPPGESYDFMTVYHFTDPASFAKRINDERWRFTQHHPHPTIGIRAVRLPPGAEFLHATPQPDTVTGQTIVTVRWGPEQQQPADSESVIEYRLAGSA